MKIISFYLPQYHSISENDKWWGEGFTEWDNVKGGKPFFEGHYQPRIPKDENYYNLLNDDVKKWQVDIAKKHGIYGFCFYHYWFNGKLLLEKPIEQYLTNKDLDLPFCISWANPPWTKAWVSRSDKILIDQKYGDKKQWKKHFDYLLPFLKDERYIRINGKPLIIIYDPVHAKNLKRMLKYWENLAQKNGFKELSFAYQQSVNNGEDYRYRQIFDYDIEFQPEKALNESLSKIGQLKFKFGKKIDDIFYKLSGRKLSEFLLRKVRKHDYDKIWDNIINTKPKDNKSVAGAFTDWDNTSRRGRKGRVFLGSTPEKFKKYLSLQIEKSKKEYNKDFMFLTAWNEWSEGSYLEPDKKYGYGYLKAVKEALNENDEFPEYPNFEE